MQKGALFCKGHALTMYLLKACNSPLQNTRQGVPKRNTTHTMM